MPVLWQTAGLLVLSNLFMTIAWVRMDHLWAGLCMLGAVYFVFRA